MNEICEDLPNIESKVQTPTSLRVDIHYAQLNLVNRWTWTRFATLCRFLNITPAELASVVLMPHAWLIRYRQTGCFPVRDQARRPIAMVLTILEASVASKLSGDTIENPFPNLETIHQTVVPEPK